jgi:hypothetical protein
LGFGAICIAAPVPWLPQNPTSHCHRVTSQSCYNLIMTYHRAKAPGSSFFFTVVG